MCLRATVSIWDRQTDSDYARVDLGGWRWPERHSGWNGTGGGSGWHRVEDVMWSEHRSRTSGHCSWTRSWCRHWMMDTSLAAPPLHTHTHTHTHSFSPSACHTVFVRRPNPISQTQSVQLVLLQPSVKFEVYTLSYPNFGGSPNLSRNSAISDKPRDVCASILQFL